MDFVSNAIFAVFQNVESLNVSSCYITHLETQFFKNATNLLKLLVSSNNIITLDANTFSEAHNLVEIDLSSNLISFVAPFGNLPKLRVLNLSSNKIKALSFNTFAALNLKELFLEDNLCIDRNFIDNANMKKVIRNSLEISTRCGDNEYVRWLLSEFDMRNDVSQKLDALTDLVGQIIENKKQNN